MITRSRTSLVAASTLVVCLLGGVGLLCDETRAAEKDAKDDTAEASILGDGEARTFEFTYETTLEPGDVEGRVELFVPLAPDTDHQTILERTIEAPFEGDVRRGDTHGNLYWYASLEELPDDPVTITITHRVRREVFRRKHLDEKSRAKYETGIREKHDEFLAPDEKVPVSSDLIEKVAEDAKLADAADPLETTRRIYDFVIDEMEYKKVGSGWGKGSTYWACSEEYGNCTDYHALFTSLSRHEDIPARFEIGFPVPTDRKKGKIGGYHCWLKFYLPGIGWTPVDASEADKHPELRDMYFGTHPANRIRFTVGRDLELGANHDTKPLNYFIYPHAEVGDEAYDGVDTAFSYREVGTSASDAEDAEDAEGDDSKAGSSEDEASSSDSDDSTDD